MASGARLVVSTRRSRGRGDEEGDQVGDGVDDVLAVVEHEQGRPCVELLRDAAADVGPLLGRERSRRADRVAHAEHRADLADDVLGRGDADELDEVHHRLLGVAREDLGERGLAEPARPDDRRPRGRGQQRAQRGRRRGRGRAASSRRSARRSGPGGRARAARDAPGRGARRGRCRPARQVLPVGLVALQRRARPAHRGLAAQQVGEQRLVVGPRGVRGLQRGQRLGVLAGAAAGLRQDHAGGREIAGRRAADLGPRVGLVVARRAQPSSSPRACGPAWRRARRRPPARRRRRARARRAGRCRPRPGRPRAGSRRRRARSRRRRARSACARPAPAAPWPGWPAARRPRRGRSAARCVPAARRRPPAPPAAPANGPPRRGLPASARHREGSRRRSRGQSTSALPGLTPGTSPDAAAPG